MNIETVKGFRDIFPPKSLQREKIIGILRKKAKEFGFLPIETPTVEYEELLKGDNESDEAVSDRFRLKDKGNRDLGLRFEFTFQLSRIFKENTNIKLPFRRYQTGSVFRDEPIRADRYREFTQFDADIIGDDSIKADAECLALGNSVLKELGIKAEIKVNNRKLLNSILEKSGVNKNQQQVLREIDKIGKLSKEEIKNNLKKLISEESIEKIFSLIERNLDYFVKNNFVGAEELLELKNIGKDYGFDISFTPTLIRGFSYYTGNVWEIWNKDKKCALVGGGRFDDKVGKYTNRKIPAVGISFGTLIDLDIKLDDQNSVLIVSLNEDKQAIKIAGMLRERGDSVSIFYGKPSKALEYANSWNIKQVIFVGAEEVKKKKFKVKDMVTGKEKILVLEKRTKKNVIVQRK
jgi:histidyl-tRNA synthetase